MIFEIKNSFANDIVLYTRFLIYYSKEMMTSLS